ncbi:MAG: hypothetical protein ABIZ56_00150, partial [Chthoniobacteraceae bacterium]
FGDLVQRIIHVRRHLVVVAKTKNPRLPEATPRFPHRVPPCDAARKFSAPDRAKTRGRDAARRRIVAGTAYGAVNLGNTFTLTPFADGDANLDAPHINANAAVSLFGLIPSQNLFCVRLGEPGQQFL